jgi:hypothetical protein
LAPSINKTTALIDNDKVVKAIGQVLKSFFFMMTKWIQLSQLFTPRLISVMVSGE